MAAIVDSTNPDSFSESLWSITWTSYWSATDRQQSRADGVAPQSSCTLRQEAPASICSTSASGRDELPFPETAKFIGKASKACSMRPICQGPGVQLVATEPVAGPVPPPTMVRSEEHTSELQSLMRTSYAVFC